MWFGPAQTQSDQRALSSGGRLSRPDNWHERSERSVGKELIILTAKMVPAQDIMGHHAPSVCHCFLLRYIGQFAAQAVNQLHREQIVS